MNLTEGSLPSPSDDWITQRELAGMFGISERTASIRARKGIYHHYEHGVPGCGRKKYSRDLISRELRRRWSIARKRQAPAAEQDQK